MNLGFLENHQAVAWPELDGETTGMWGPDDKEREQLNLQQTRPAEAALPAKVETESGDEERKLVERDEAIASLVWPKQKAETTGFWGPDTEEREQLANLVAKDNWDRFFELDLDMEGSFSYDL